MSSEREWADLSDEELGRRLEWRGVDPAAAARWVELRDDPTVAARIGAVFDRDRQ